MSLNSKPDTDDRVRCWFCRRRTRTQGIPLRSHDSTGRLQTIYVPRSVCELGLGYDPLILRRCSQFQQLAAQYVEKLPDNAP